MAEYRPPNPLMKVRILPFSPINPKKGCARMIFKKKSAPKEKYTIDYNELQLNQQKFTTSEIGRGVGIHKPKKGKGSYTRKPKHPAIDLKPRQSMFQMSGRNAL